MPLFNRLIIAISMSLILAGCAKMYGVVTPADNGSYQAVNVAGNKPEVFKAADHDARLWCKKKHGTKNYVVLKQDVVQDEAPDVDLGNKLGNALVQAARYADRLNRDDDFEATTQFRCRG